MRALASVWMRGASIVCLVSLNTRLIATGQVWESILVGGMISAVWWLNARAANRVEGGRALVAYSVGASCGTAVGLWIATLI